MRIIAGALKCENNQNCNLLDLASLLYGKLHIFSPEVTVGGNFRLRNMTLIKAFGDGKIESMYKAKLSLSQSALRNDSIILGCREHEGDAQGEPCLNLERHLRDTTFS